MEQVLLVEDEAPICLLLAEALTDAGYAVTEALTPEEASAALAREADSYRVLVTDINVCVRGWGFQFAHRAVTANPRLAVVYITGDSEVDVAHRGLPGSAILPKPFAPADLVRLVRRMLERRVT